MLVFSGELKKEVSHLRQSHCGLNPRIFDQLIYQDVYGT